MSRTCRVVISLLLSIALLLLPIVPVGEIISFAVSAGDGTYTWPVSVNTPITAGMYYSSGKYHGATDFGCAVGSPVYATASGTVIQVEDRGCFGSHRGEDCPPVCPLGSTCNAVKYSGRATGSYGNFIIIDHGNNVYSLYGHLKTGTFCVEEGDYISQGQIIASSGNSGNSTGPHLHFELRMGGNAYSACVNPQDYLTKINPTPTTYDEPPTTPTVTVDKQITMVNDDITILFSAERVDHYWVGIYKDDVLFNDYSIYHKNSITVDYPWVGEYHIVVVAINNCGETSGYGSFYVGKEGDYVPENFTVACNKTTAMKNESVTLSFSADWATTYWVGIYHNDEWVLRDNYTTNTFTVKYSDPGEYRAAIVAMNPCSSSETKYVTFTVLDVESAPTKPTVTIDKNVNLINEPIIISFDSIGAEDYWVGIYKDDVLFNDYATIEKQITVDYPWVGEYRVAVVARNSYGETSGYGGFYVGKEGDYVPTNFTLTGNKTLALKNEAVKVTFNADYATDYWIGVYHNGKWLGTDAVTGHTFTMWYSDLGEYSVAVVARNACSSTNAKYYKFTVVEQKTFSIQYDSNGGYNAPHPQSKEYNESIQLSVQTPVREGYSFIGWNTRADGSGMPYIAGTVYSSNANLLLYAQWRANTYSVIFNGNGSTGGSMSNQTFTYDVAQNLTANAFERDYTVTYNYDGAIAGNSDTTAVVTAAFNGWATSERGIVDFADAQNVKNLIENGSIELYANWTLGSISLPTPTKAGYVFEGWFTDSAFSSPASSPFTPTDNETLYAKWTAITIADIAVKTMPDKTNYIVGDTLDTTGLELTATKSNGTYETVTNGFSCTPSTLPTAGTQTITVSYGGKTTTFDVTVQNPEIPEGAPRMTLSKEKARAGERVDVTLSIDNNPGIVATSINLTYDDTKLRLIEVKDGGLLGTTSFSPGNDLTAVPYTVVWVDGLSSQNYTANGVMATFTFEVLEEAPIGETTVTLHYVTNSTFNVDLTDVLFALTDGNIEVIDRTPGDVNKDGVVDLKDVVILRRFLSGGWNVTIDESNSDVNGDDEIDLKDAVLIVRYLAGGWGVTLK